MENDDLHGSVRQQAQLHLMETTRHAELVKTCLESMGADPSVVKTGIAQVMETVKGMFNAGREGFSRIFAFHSADDKVKLVEDTLTGMEEADKRHYNKPESTTPESPLPTPGMKNTITRTK